MRLRWRLVAVAAALPALVAGWAAPADAHAILLRTDPAPQTTVARAPADVRLIFSEPVEVTFGAVRVFDVDANRVDEGRIRRENDNREVVVPVGRIGDGTYTVTWRVVSDDGHEVHGGFAFYVGSPSSISARAVPGEHGAGTTVGWAFGAVRFVWFVALLALVGMIVVRRWVWTPVLRAEGLIAEPLAADFRKWSARVLVAAWATLALDGLASLVFEAASVSGLSLARSARPTVLRQVLHTGYGRYWVLSMVGVILAVLPVAGLTRRRRLLQLPPDAWIGVAAVAVATICVAAGLNGHARTLEHPNLGVPALAVHLFAVTVWTGGLAVVALIALGLLRRLPGQRRSSVMRGLVLRFGAVALIAASVVVATGTANAVLDLAHPADLWHTTYGRVITAKILLLGLALAMAAGHRWVVPRRLATAGDGAAALFQWSARVETAVLLAAVGLAAALVVLVPGRSLALAANGPVNQERVAGGYTIQLFLDPSAVGANQVHISFVNPAGLGAAEVTGVSANVRPPAGSSQAVDMRLIAPGHFVGDATLPAASRYDLAVTASGASGRLSTSFSFRLTSRSGQKE